MGLERHGRQRHEAGPVGPSLRESLSPEQDTPERFVVLKRLRCKILTGS